MTKVIIWGKSGQLPKALVYPASSLLLGRPPLLSSFPHSSWNSSDSAGWDLLSQLKAQILLPPGSYFCCALLQEQIDSTVCSDEMRVERARLALSIQIKLKDPSQFSHPKQYPLKPEGWWGFMPIINSLKQQGLLISCFSPYNKFKIVIKVNFKIQVTK
jgi:hypothetical protein